MTISNRYFSFRALLAALVMLLLCVPAAVAQQTDPAIQEIAALFRQGVDALQKRDYDTAERLLQSAYSKSEAIQDKYSMGAMLDALGGVYMARGDTNRSLEATERAVSYLRAAGNRKTLANALRNLALTYNKAGQPEKGIPCAEESLSIREELKDGRGVVQTMQTLGILYRDAGQLSRALQTLEQTLQQQDTLGLGPGSLADTHNEIGRVYETLADSAKARKAFETAVALAQQGNNLSGHINALNNLAVTIGGEGQYAVALAIHEQVLALREKVGDPQMVAQSLTNIAGLSYEWGRYDWSLYYARRALAIGEKTGSKSLIAGSYVTIGATLNTLGQRKQAAEVLTKALVLFEAIGDETGFSKAGYNLGHLLLSAGNAVAAEGVFQRILPAAQKGGNVRWIADVQAAHGMALDAIGKPEAALDEFLAAHQQYDKSGNPTLQARSYSNLGTIYSHLKRNQDAFQAFQNALTLQKRVGSPRSLAITQSNLAGILMEQGKWEQAEPLLKEAITNAEKVRDVVSAPADIGAFQTENLGDVYGRYAKVLVHLNQVGEALTQVERGRGQGLARQAGQMQNDWASVLPGDDARKLKERRQALQKAEAGFHSAESQLEKLPIFADARSRSAATQAMEEARRVRDEAQLALTAYRNDLAARHPAYRVLGGLDNPTPETFLALARANPDTLYLTWAVGPNDTLLFAFREGVPAKAFPIAITRGLLKKRIDEWREAITLSESGGPGTDARREKVAAQELYTILFDPLEKAGLLSSPAVKRLVVLGDGPLRELPFAALSDAAGRRLIQRYPLTTGVSLRLLIPATGRGSETTRAPGRGILCIADPGGGDERLTQSDLLGGFAPLPAARKEGQEIARLFGAGATLLVGNAATKETVSARLSSARLLHFATHGTLDDQEGLRSGLLLAPPKADAPLELPLLTGNDILGHSLSAEMVVLSACETGRGERSGGEGLLGLVWAFRAAGCPSIVASQWSVDDTSTGDLMVKFYTSLRAGQRRDEALRDAMLSVLGASNGKTAAPYYWAAFQLHGESRPLMVLKPVPGK